MRKRSKFELSHVNSLSCKMGYIVPIMLQECLPGDTFPPFWIFIKVVTPKNLGVNLR